jgi:hypothetical protein
MDVKSDAEWTGSGFDDLVTGSELVGSFSYVAADNNWSMSREVYTMHGLLPGTPMTTEMVLAFEHPDDRLPAAELLGKVLSSGKPFCFPHRIINTAGQVRNVVIIGGVTRDAAGHTVRIDGYALDLTDSQSRYAQRAGTEAIRGALEHRAAIEQAKGALMLAYGINPAAAIELLKWHSRQNNVKLHLIAERLVDVLETTTLTSAGMRQVFDRMLHDIAHRK